MNGKDSYFSAYKITVCLTVTSYIPQYYRRFNLVSQQKSGRIGGKIANLDTLETLPGENPLQKVDDRHLAGVSPVYQYIRAVYRPRSLAISPRPPSRPPSRLWCSSP